MINIHDIATAMSEKFNIDGLNVKDNQLEIEIDGYACLIEETDAEVFIFSGIFGDAPTEGGETFANILLEGNIALMNTKNAALARNPQTKAYVLMERALASEISDFETFCERLGNFANTLEMWHNMLQEFRPAAEQSAKASLKKETLTADALCNGFLRA